MFPDYLDGAKVLEYTDPGHFGFLLDYDEENNPIAVEVRYLAVCSYIGSDSYHLFGCNEQYNVISDGCFGSPEICKICRPDAEDAAWNRKSTPYLYTASRQKELGGSCYFEFQRGRYHGGHWLDRSVYLHADLFDGLKLFDIFDEALPHFNYYGPTEVTPAQYDTLKALAMARGGEAAALMEELDCWVQECFFTENVFTICRI